LLTKHLFKDLKINPTFKALIPPLSEEEKMQLEENLLENGIREAISIWGDVIIDGHNRYDIAQKHNLPYYTESYKFNSESDVIIWIIKNQFGRRNLTAYDRSALALRLKPVISEQAKEKQTESGGAVRQKSDKPVIDTKKVLAEMAGVSHDTIAKVERIEQSATPEILNRLKRGEISINKAYQDVRSQEKPEQSENKNPKPKPSTVSYKIKSEIFLKYFDDAMTQEEIGTIIEIALEEYFKKQGGNV
jgi:transcriptional regulator with XRE-family HTH domain